MVEAFDAAYARRKRERSKACGDALDIFESFGNVPKTSKSLETFPPVVVVVGVGGVGEKQILASPSAPNGIASKAAYSENDVLAVWTMWPNKGGKKQGLESIRKALQQRSASGCVDPVEI
jgi:hypothetical protein